MKIEDVKVGQRVYIYREGFDSFEECNVGMQGVVTWVDPDDPELNVEVRVAGAYGIDWGNSQHLKLVEDLV